MNMLKKSQKVIKELYLFDKLTNSNNINANNEFNLGYYY